jgi:hypothetical protein
MTRRGGPIRRGLPLCGVGSTVPVLVVQLRLLPQYRVNTLRERLAAERVCLADLLGPRPDLLPRKLPLADRRRRRRGLQATEVSPVRRQTNGGSQHYRTIIGEGVGVNLLKAEMPLDPGEGINRDLSDQ